MVVFDSKGDTIANGRQVDISAATFESESGRVVPRFQLKTGDRLLIVSDPSAPTEWRPPAKPGGMRSMVIRVLPLKALVVERIAAF
jgi:hypothetical protein